MAHIYLLRCLLALHLLSIIPSLALASDRDDARKPQVVVANYPLKYFASRIAGPRIDIVFPAPTTADPEFWLPNVSSVRLLQHANIIFINGAGYEKWLGKINMPEDRLVDTSKELSAQFINAEDSIIPRERPLSDNQIAATTWLDPILALQQARVIRDRLVQAQPQYRAEFFNNFAALENDLRELDNAITQLLRQNPAVRLLASHPVYQYFAAHYAMNISSVRWSPETVPAPEELDKLREVIRGEPTQGMLWTAAPRAETVALLRQMGVRAIVFNPCANLPASGDFITVMQHNIDNLAVAINEH